MAGETAPTITSPESAVGAVGVAFSFTVQTTGDPVPAITGTNVPGFLTLVDNQDGTATVSGTPPEVFDAVSSTTYNFTITAGNAVGVVTQYFTFLSVESPQTPISAVMPVQPVLPTGSEISVPFRIDPATGQVAVISTYPAIAAQHVASLINTALTERVMLPTYGSTVPNTPFAVINDALVASISLGIHNAVGHWEPSVHIDSIQVSEVPGNPSTVQVVVQFSLAVTGQTAQVSVIPGGSLYEVLTA